MQAIRVRQFGGPEVLTLEETLTPVPSAGQALVGIGAAGVKPVDTYIRAGACARPIDPRLGRSRHRRICRPGASHTSNPANATTAAAPSPAPYATHALAHAATQLQPLPDHTSYESGARIFIAYYAAYHRGNVLAGDTVLVHGASGGVGLAAPRC